ncbi:MAG: glycosyltransferase [Ignavibacteriales bacterium]|nr:MAG: glycosyltransferase [Ignavibacteriales bacterium]
MQNKIKVLMFIDALVAGGKERRMIELLKGFEANENIECEVAVMHKKIHYEEIHSLNVKIHFLLRKIKKDPLIFFRLAFLCIKIKPDIIHVWDPMTGFYASPVAFLLRIKLINAMITHASPAEYSGMKKRTKVFHFFSDVMLANSYAGLKVHNITSAKGRVIHNGFNFNRTAKLESIEKIKTQFGLNDKKVVGMVAAFSAFKDYKTFIKAANIVLEKRNDVLFVCVGDGPKLNECKSIVQKNNSDRIIFTGKQKNVENIVNVFDIGVLSTFNEGISNSIMEYMALSKPVVVTEGGGSSEIVAHNITGYLVKQGDEAEMAEKILFLLDNPEAAKEMGIKGRTKLEKEFNLSRMVNETFSVYTEVLS